MKDIPGYEGLYAADESGKIWGYRGKGRFLKPWLIGHGYEAVMLFKDKKSRKFLVHRLIAITFIPNPENHPEVNHIDNNIRNNRLENLEWCTSKGNKVHNRKKGRKIGVQKLTEAQVREIYRLYLDEHMLQKDIARIFNISQTNISWIVRGDSWKHILD